METYRMYFGRNIEAQGKKVTRKAFESFIAKTIAPQFEGFTVTEAVGYWKGNKEQTTIIEILTANAEGINAIAKAYAKQFSQDAVLVQKVTGTHDFVTQD